MIVLRVKTVGDLQFPMLQYSIPKVHFESFFHEFIDTHEDVVIMDICSLRVSDYSPAVVMHQV
jgi:hypothetical protein